MSSSRLISYRSTEDLVGECLSLERLISVSEKHAIGLLKVLHVLETIDARISYINVIPFPDSVSAIYVISSIEGTIQRTTLSIEYRSKHYSIKIETRNYNSVIANVFFVDCYHCNFQLPYSSIIGVRHYLTKHACGKDQRYA